MKLFPADGARSGIFLCQIRPRTIYVKKTLCDVYQVTPRRRQKLQEKNKANAELDDKRGKHSNRPMPLLAGRHQSIYKRSSKTGKPSQHGKFTETLLKS
jgi:hypothetical protein